MTVDLVVATFLTVRAIGRMIRHALVELSSFIAFALDGFDDGTRNQPPESYEDLM